MKILCLADKSEKAQQALMRLDYLYDFINIEEQSRSTPDIIIALGGDGFMLHTLHRYMYEDVAIYGMNCGKVGFLLNTFQEENLQERIENSHPSILKPLSMRVTCSDGNDYHALAINEISMLRQTIQTAKLELAVDGNTSLAEIYCDGMIVATPAGSTAYNLAANGSVIPLESDLLAVTPICPFRPKRWRGALLPSDKEIEITVLNSEKRPVSAAADFHEFREVEKIHISLAQNISKKLLFDPNHKLEDRILKEQFVL